MQDAVQRVNLTASQGASTNGLNFPFYLRKIVVNSVAAPTAVASVILFDDATATGTQKAKVQTDQQAANIFSNFQQADFDPPVAFEIGGSTTIAGSAGVTVDIYFIRR